MDAPLDSRITALAAETQRRLAAAGTPSHRQALLRFFREPIRCHGVPSPEIRVMAREIYREVKNWPAASRDHLCEELWANGELENGTLVAYLYGRFAKKLGLAEFRRLDNWIASRVNNWAHCDAICTGPVAACIANCPELAEQAAAWTVSKGRWRRRAAAVSLVKEARAGRQLETILRVAEDLRQDPDDMVLKGVGWMLKEAYPKRPVEIVRFITTRPEPFPRLVLRYAAEKMSPADRDRVLLR